MAKEYGLINGSIKCPMIFTLDMENQMPYDRVIDVVQNGCIYYWESYTITEEMVERELENRKE